MSTSQIVTKNTPDGKWKVTATLAQSATTVAGVNDMMTNVSASIVLGIDPVEQPPIKPVEPVIPSTAVSSGILDNATGWKQEQDAGVNSFTSKVSSMTNVYSSADKARIFGFVGTGKPGVRWSHSAKGDTTKFHFCYRGKVRSANWSLVQQLELDMNQSLPNGYNVFLCTQFDSFSKTVQVTRTPSGHCQWFNSNVKHDFQNWPANQWIDFAIYTEQDGKGNVTYVGIRFNGVYYPFDPSCNGLSWLKLNWPSGTIIPNFQLNAAKDPSGTVSVEASNLEYLQW